MSKTVVVLENTFSKQRYLRSSGPDQDKTIAHGLLCEWYRKTIEIHEPQSRTRYLLAICHHANRSAEFCGRASPPGALSSKTVLEAACIMDTTRLEQNDLKLPSVCPAYPFLSQAHQAQEVHENKSRLQWQKKRAKNLNGYRCASEFCDIETDSGYMLSQCASWFPFPIELAWD